MSAFFGVHELFKRNFWSYNIWRRMGGGFQTRRWHSTRAVSVLCLCDTETVTVKNLQLTVALFSPHPTGAQLFRLPVAGGHIYTRRQLPLHGGHF